MQTYTQMKNSGVAYLGDIPDEWNLLRASILFKENKQTNANLISIEPMQFKLGEIIDKNIDIDDKAKEEIRRYTVVEKDDIMVNGLNLNYDFLTQRVAIVKKSGCITPAYISLRTRKSILPMYACYLLKALDGQKVLNGWGTGIRLTLNYSEFKKYYLPVPAPDNQQRIVDYLDKETALIDDLIAKQQHLLELLEEKRRATITHAVTRGLNPKVELKETGIAWLGKIPSDWDLVPIKSVAQINNGSDYKDIEVLEGGYPVIGSGGEFARASKYAFDGKTVLFGRKGTIDKPLYFEGKFWTVDTMFWSKINETRIIPKFLYFSALAIPYEFYQTKTALPSMTQSNLLNHQVVLPSMSEQQRIIDSLELHEHRFNVLKQKILTQIDLLKERRTSLISHAVTGKVKI